MDSTNDSAGAPVQSVVHTPGPWECNGNAVHKRRSPLYATCIAVCDGADRYANAKAIAALPDLIEALQLLWTEVSESGNATANDFGWKRAREATLAALRKVV